MIPRPDICDSPAWSFPLPQVSELSTGVTIWTYDLPGQYILACNLVLELPLNSEPDNHHGVSTIAVRCLDEGTHTHPGSQYALALEDIGATFHGHIGLSTVQCLLDLPDTGLATGLELLAEAVTSPAYDENDVLRIKANRLFEIEQQESRGSYVASTALKQALFDRNLRMSQPVGGSHDQVCSLTAADVASYQARHYGSQGATLIIAGDLRGVDALGAARSAFGGWNPVTTPIAAERPAPGDMTSHLIHRDGAVQADVRMGWFGIDRHDPRWASLQVAVAIMGGSFNSRLNTVLREEKGYTYGVSMGVHPFREAGYISVSTSTRTSAVADLVGDALDILKARKDFTENEIHDAIGYLTLSAPLSLNTAEAVAGQGATIAAARLDLDYVTTSLSALSRVTASTAMDAYRELIDSDNPALIVVGDCDEITGLGITPDPH